MLDRKPPPAGAAAAVAELVAGWSPDFDTIEVFNAGPANATGVVVEDVLPAGVTFVAASGPGTYDEITGIWNAGSVLRNESAFLSITVSIDQRQIDRWLARARAPFDLILTEGYKRAHKPKIEISRRERGTEPVSRTEDIIAVVSDHPTSLEVPHFDLDDAPGVADLIQARYLS